MNKIAWAVLLVALLAAQASALSMRADWGETYIRWSWDDNTTVQIFIDGQYVQDSPTSYYFLDHITPGSEHRIELRNASPGSAGEVMGTSTMKASPPITLLLTVLVLTGIALPVAGLMFFGKGLEIPCLFAGGFGVLLGIYGSSLSYNAYGLSLIFYILIIGLGFVCLAKIGQLVNEEVKTW
jgi:hypothetical protein